MFIAYDITLELKPYLDFVICFNSYLTIRSQWTHTTLSIHGLANRKSQDKLDCRILQLQIWYRLAEFEELAVSAMMGLLKEAPMVVCLSDVNTILSFHALLRLLGDRDLPPAPALSAQFLWLASVSRKHGGRLDRSGKRRSHFSSYV